MRRKWSDLSDFIGTWEFDREFDNGSKGTGIAVFVEQDSNMLEYIENGALILKDGQTLKSSIRYYYKIQPKEILVYFFENPSRLFQRVEFEDMGKEIAGRATHYCGNDIYCSEYKFLENDTFQIIHKVHGPRKSYTSKTRFRRVGV